MLRHAVPLLLLLAGAGCATPRVVRLDTGRDAFVVTPIEAEGTQLAAARLADEEFEEALVELAHDVRPSRGPMQQARALFGIPSRGGVYQYEPHGRRLIPQDPETRTVRTCWSRMRTMR